MMDDVEAVEETWETKRTAAKGPERRGFMPRAGGKRGAMVERHGRAGWKGGRELDAVRRRLRTVLREQPGDIRLMVRQGEMLVKASLAEHRVSGGSREVLSANLTPSSPAAIRSAATPAPAPPPPARRHPYMQLNTVGFILREGPTTRLINAVRLVANGTFVCETEVIKSILVRLMHWASYTDSAQRKGSYRSGRRKC